MALWCSWKNAALSVHMMCPGAQCSILAVVTIFDIIYNGDSQRLQDSNHFHWNSLEKSRNSDFPLRIQQIPQEFMEEGKDLSPQLITTCVHSWIPASCVFVLGLLPLFGWLSLLLGGCLHSWVVVFVLDPHDGRAVMGCWFLDICRWWWWVLVTVRWWWWACIAIRCHWCWGCGGGPFIIPFPSHPPYTPFPLSSLFPSTPSLHSLSFIISLTFHIFVLSFIIPLPFHRTCNADVMTHDAKADNAMTLNANAGQQRTTIACPSPFPSTSSLHPLPFIISLPFHIHPTPPFLYHPPSLPHLSYTLPPPSLTPFLLSPSLTPSPLPPPSLYLSLYVLK